MLRIALEGWTVRSGVVSLTVYPELTRLIVESRELSAIMSASFGTARYKERNGATTTEGVTETATAMSNRQSTNQCPIPNLNQLPDYQITRLPDPRMPFPFSTGLVGSLDHSDHDPA